MSLVFLLIGVVVVVAAFRNSQTALFTAVGTDVPEFVIWGAALLAIGALGYVPGLKTVSKWLLGLVVLVLVVNNYQAISSGFTSAWKNPPPSSGTSPTQSGNSGTSPAPTTSPDPLGLNSILGPVPNFTGDSHFQFGG